MNGLILAATPGVRRITALIIVFGLLMACGQVDVSHYKGDGDIIPVGTGITRGYKVVFDEVDLSQPFQQRYRIVDYPVLCEGAGPWFYLKVRAKKTDIEGILGGYLSYRLSTFENVKIFHWADELRNWRRSELSLDKDYAEYEFYYWISSRKSTYFDPQEMEDIPGLNRLYLDVQYEPRGTRRSIKGVIELEAGGTK